MSTCLMNFTVLLGCVAMELSSMIVISSDSELEVQAGASTPVLSSQFTPTKRPPSSSESMLAPWTALCNVLICISLGFLASESDVDDERPFRNA